MDTDRGRKTVGGKMEIILKVREPLVDKDVEVVNEKWLVLDSHLRALEMVSGHDFIYSIFHILFLNMKTCADLFFCMWSFTIGFCV